MQPTHPADEPVPADIQAQVMAAALDEMARWGVERFSIEAMAERHRLDPTIVYRYWGDRQGLMIDAVLADAEALSVATDTGSLREDLRAFARNITARINTEDGRTVLRALAMGRLGHHDEITRMLFWRARFPIVRAVIDRARKRGELRDGVSTLAAVQIVMAPLNIRALFSDAVVDDEYTEAIADLAFHAIVRK